MSLTLREWAWHLTLVVSVPTYAAFWPHRDRTSQITSRDWRT